jgi:site-specific DNA-methyltransferase (adenine-specific)
LFGLIRKVDAVIADPPYSSGGLFAGARKKDPIEKYILTGTKKTYATFSGDCRDQRSFTFWSMTWMARALSCTREGGLLLCFSDWRQLPSMTDAIQAGGWVWRGIIPWDKTEGVRPQMGWFRAQCEYILSATNGAMSQERAKKLNKCLPGIFRENVGSRTKRYPTGKPVSLLESLLGSTLHGETVLDPYMGSGTTGIACLKTGRKFIGIEMDRGYFDIARERIEAELASQEACS